MRRPPPPWPALCAAAALVLLAGCSSEQPVASAVPVTDADDRRSALPRPSRAAAVVARGDGVLRVVPGTGAPSGPGTPTAYVVEVEGGLGVDAAAFARQVEATLADPRSWGGSGRRAMRRVDRGPVGVRVALVSPRTTDRLCAPLQTRSSYSCANGERAVLNSARWLTGTRLWHGRLPEYRQYLVNHEVGHVLGRGHERCPVPGGLAPVMVQQTITLDGCRANAWPYP